MPELKISVDNTTFENLKIISERTGLAIDEIIRELIVRNIPILRSIVERSDIKTLCGGINVDINNLAIVDKVIQAAQILAAIKRLKGEIPTSIRKDEIQLKRKVNESTKLKRIGYLKELGIAMEEGDYLIIEYPELAERLLNCAKVVEKLYGKRLISYEEDNDD